MRKNEEERLVPDHFLFLKKKKFYIGKGKLSAT